MAESKLSMSQQGALATEKVNSALGCIKSSIAKRLRKVMMHPTWYSLDCVQLPGYDFKPPVQERLVFLTVSKFSGGPSKLSGAGVLAL